MKSTKFTKISALLSAIALFAGISASVAWAEEAAYVTERIYADKTIKLCHDNANPTIEVDGEYIGLNYNTTGILSFDLGYTGNVSSVKLGIAKWYGENNLYAYGLNNVVYDNYKMNGTDFAVWDSFVPQQNESLYTLTSTQPAFNNYDELDITEFASGINSSRYLSIGLKKAGAENQSILWAKAMAFQPYIEVTRNITQYASDFVDAVNNSTDEIGVEAAIDHYAQSTGLDYKRYSMIDYCDLFAKELVGKNYAGFAQLKNDFDALLEKYVPKTEIPCEFFSAFTGGELNCLGSAADSRTIKEANSCTVIFGYKTDAVNAQTLKGAQVRFKQATDNTAPYKMGLMLKYIFSDTYPELKYGGKDSEAYQNWKAFLPQETAINKKIDISDLAGDTFYADVPELVSPLGGNVGKELILHATIPAYDKNNRNSFNIYMDSALIVYHDVSASFASLQNILDGAATAAEIKAWAEEFGANYNIDANALYDMDGVYQAIAGQKFNTVDELCAEFNRAVESNYVTKYIRSSADIIRVNGGNGDNGGYTFHRTDYVTGNGNGWNIVINSFEVPASKFVKDLSYVVTYRWIYEAGKNIQIKAYSTENIPAIPDCELTKEGTKYTSGAEYDTWKQYYSSMQSSTLTHELTAEANIGDTAEIKLPEEMLRAVQAGAAQLNVSVSGSGNLQMNSTYNTSGETPSQLKVTYDKTVFGPHLLTAVNSAENADDVAAALNEYSLALADYAWYEALSENAKKLLAEEVYGRQYAGVPDIDAVLREFASVYQGQKFVIKDAADDNGTIRATIVNVAGEAKRPIVLAAYYDKHTMVKAVTYSGTDVPLEAYGEAAFTIGSYNGAYDHVKVFVFDSLNTIEAWAKSFDVK